MKRHIVTAVIYYYIMIEFHYAKDDSRLLAYGGVGTEVSYFCSICYKNIKILAECLLTFFPIHNTSICRATFCVMKLGRYVIVDDGGNYVTFSQAVRSDQDCCWRALARQHTILVSRGKNPKFCRMSDSKLAQ